MTEPPRIALFLCDNPIPTVREESGDYTDIFNTLLRKSRPDVQYALDSYNVKDNLEYPSPEDIDKYSAIILTGSASSAYEDVEWINVLVPYIASIAKEKPHIKLIGICFGHQIISRALGSECVRNEVGWEAGITVLDLTDVGRELFGQGILNIQQMHRDHVPKVPDNCHLLGSTDVTYNQGFIRFRPGSSQKISPPPTNFDRKDIQIFTVQGHPEFTKSIVSTLVGVRNAAGVIDDATAEKAKSREDWLNDGVGVIGKVIWGIIGAV